ncbi:phenylalanine--tRNA ligase subunit beta [Aminipila luticellarii]|uniref:Phenylalanine--tRNA ligase beta subunit n=1 Tax=Aminipila luticellarii TaxID=2507160 RepID=A0A410PWI7_9FIRM|nr:phenylalanine--tRNA ligase subunit beta [Aminipila luticellarii]QAT43299.1 phenylalanine--tRNA ligase subunit beta [Aminipila luticellarii]
MLVPVEWLKDYTDVNVSVDEFCDKMIMSGSNLETVEYFGENTDKVVVGKILKIEKHPDADKLVVCQVDAGQEGPVQIVTGAANVFEGACVPVALHGSTIPGPIHGQPKQEGGVKITKGKLRGVESFGMLCSAAELGLGDKVIPVAHKEGIWILGEEYPIGQELTEALGLKMAVVDFEITPNRPDCLSMIGMAREAAATFKEKLCYPDTVCTNEKGNAEEHIRVEVKRPELCKRYVARIVTDVKIEQSPWWLQKRLIAAGMRPINNIVDITNFVMLEYGQPLHAFDIRRVEENRIVVDTAEEGELFTTLDGTERKLTRDMLLIKDGKKAVAIAGVMGGMNSEIEPDTATIMIESANFSGDSVRATSKKLGLRTEASARFEKGIDPNLCEAAADRVCRLIELLGAGTVCKGSVDVYPAVERAKTLDVRVDRINKVLGIKLSREVMEEFLERLEMKVAGEGNILTVTPPTIRQDLEIEEDYVEEIARMYGYDKLPTTLPKSDTEACKSKARTLKDLARDTMCALGANEVQTYSFCSPKSVDNVRIDEDSWERSFVRLLNPLGEETSVMRTILTPNMMEVLGTNYRRNIEAVRAFELGNTFMANLSDPHQLPEESDSMCIGLYGRDESFYTLKGMVTELLNVLGITDVAFERESEYGVYHPGRCARIVLEDMELGIMGEVHPDVTEKYGIAARCYVCELFFDNVLSKSDREVVYKPLPKYPSTSRDIALLVDEAVPVGKIREIIKANGGKILEKVELFDVYRGKQVAEGKKSAAFNLTYRSEEMTLTDDDVAKVHNKVLEALKNELDAVLRDM